jgi:membrane-associated phospholipid phosphatase
MATRVRPPVLASAACAAALVPLAIAAYALAPVEHLDASLFMRIAYHVGPVADAVANAVAHLADPVPLLAMTLLACGLAWGSGRRREAAAAAAVVVGANVTTQLLKLVLAHPRYQPYAGLGHPTEYAFPSGHTTAAVSIAIAFALAVPPHLRGLAAVLGTAFAGSVAVSVVALEWHFPSDVLGGILVAGAWGFAALAWLRSRGEVRSGRPQAATRAAISTK